MDGGSRFQSRRYPGCLAAKRHPIQIQLINGDIAQKQLRRDLRREFVGFSGRFERQVTVPRPEFPHVNVVFAAKKIR